MAIQITDHFAPLFDKSDPNYHRRYKFWYGGRGGMKTDSISKALLIAGTQKPERVLCAREFQNSISDSVIRSLSDEIEVLGLQDFYTVQRDAIHGKNGTEFMFKGLRHNIKSIKSIKGITRAWLEEAENVSEESFVTLDATVRLAGSDIICSYNTDEEDDFVYLNSVTNPLPDSYVCKVNYLDNPWLPDTLYKQAEWARLNNKERYDNVWLGFPKRAGLGAVYGKEVATAGDEGRISPVPYTSSVPVNTYWDLGYADQTAIWFGQVVGREPRAIDYYENNLEALDHYVEIIRARNYHYAKHILPHDAGHKSLRTGKTLAQQLQDMGLGTIGESIIVLPPASVAPGIELGRQLLGNIWMDEVKCKQGIHCLRKYHYKWDEDRKVFSKEPYHDWSSNGADAFRYMAAYLATRQTTKLIGPGSASGKAY